MLRTDTRNAVAIPPLRISNAIVFRFAFIGTTFVCSYMTDLLFLSDRLALAKASVAACGKRRFARQTCAQRALSMPATPSRWELTPCRTRTMLDFRPRGYKVLLDLSTGPRWQLVHVNAAPDESSRKLQTTKETSVRCDTTMTER